MKSQEINTALNSIDFQKISVGLKLSLKTILKNVEHDDIILDSGCGPGILVKILRSMDLSVVGMDLIKESDETSLIADARRTPFREKKFSTIFAIGIL